MKKVVVVLHLYVPGTYTVSPLHGARGTYLSKLAKYGVLPILVSTEMDSAMVDWAYQNSQGALFMGGHDFDARNYQEENHPHNELTDSKLDQLELDLMKRSLKDKKPILAICRGCQGLAIVSGGALYQHLPDLHLGEEHGDSDEKGYHTILKTAEHDVYIDRDSKAFQLLKKELVSSTTGHHQGVKSIGQEFVASGRSPAGVIEIIEHRDKNYFCFGIQGHPELLQDSDLEVFFSEFAKSL